jgi:hypothetical protein
MRGGAAGGLGGAVASNVFYGCVSNKNYLRFFKDNIE